QFPQGIGGRLEAVAFIDQPSNLARRCLPVDLAVAGEDFELGQSFQLRLALPAQSLCVGNAQTNVAQSLFQALAFVTQGAQLVGVTPAQHIATAVVDAAAVVLFVASARVLYLPGAGDG